LSDSDDLVAVYKAENVTEAHIVRNLLLDAGVDAVVSEENEPLGLPITPTEVLVRRGDESRARPVVEDYDKLQKERADRPDWVCPACNATVVGAFDECDVCGANRPGSEVDDGGDEEDDAAAG
jgi:hypothetical protein